MSPMLDVQQAHATVFRLRFGERKGNAPARLTDQIRVTADNPDIVDAFIARYDGERRQWEGAWEAYLPTKTISIVLIPGQSLSQWWEKYEGSVCKRRCDGQTEFKSGKPCLCPTRDPDERNKKAGECTATTRVSIMCPDVDVVGAGMFVSHGMMAARSLPTSIAVANAALAAGIYVDALLRVVEFTGEKRRWVVPQIEVVGTSLDELIATARELRAGNGGVLDGSATTILGRPIPPLAELGSGEPRTIREQAEAIDNQPARAPRKNAAQPIPATGIAPRTAADAGQDIIDVEAYDEDEDSDGGRPAVGEGSPVGDNRPSVAAGDPTFGVAKAAREAGLDDELRHDLAEWASDGRTRSSKELTELEAFRARRACGRIRDDGHVLARAEAGDMRLLDRQFRFAHTPESFDDDNDRAETVVNGLSYEQIQAMSADELTEQLRAAGLALGGKAADRVQRLLAHYGHGTEAF